MSTSTFSDVFHDPHGYFATTYDTSAETESKMMFRPTVGALEEITPDESRAVIEVGGKFAKALDMDGFYRGAPCLIIAGPLMSPPQVVARAEDQVMRYCMDIFGYPTQQTQDPKAATINVLLDSLGGSLDSAFKIVRYLRYYASELNVYVPRRAKSASTLIALGAGRIYLSPFGELGPLDTQIVDSRNPNRSVSALDRYKCLHYVRQFGVDTISKVFRQLSADVGDQMIGGEITIDKLLDTASEFAIKDITPMLTGLRALDFGLWAHSLQIAERYADILLRGNGFGDVAQQIAKRLVYEYPHHLFPIDYLEACDIGLPVTLMTEEIHALALRAVQMCHGKTFIGFVSEEHAKLQRAREEEGARIQPVQMEIPNSGEHARPTERDD